MTGVLVVGAGPTGLALACGLLQHGVSVRVVDKVPTPATTSRANILFGRGVEVLARLGALGDLPQRSIEPGRLTTYVNGRPLVSMRLSDLLDGEEPARLGKRADGAGGSCSPATRPTRTARWAVRA